MSNTKDGPGKGGPGKPTPESGAPKKPTAIIDLKATEVTPQDAKSDPKSEQKPAAGSTAAGAAAAAASGQSVPPVASSGAAAGSGPQPVTPSTVSTAGKWTSASADAGKASAASAAASAAGKTTASSATSTPSVGTAAKSLDKPADKTSAPIAPAPAARRGGGIASVFTHTIAGIAGGFLALLGAETLGPQIGEQLGIPGLGTGSQQTSLMQQRLTDLEAQVKKGPPTAAVAPELAQRIAATDRKIADLEKVAAEVAGLREANAKLAADAKAMAERAAKGEGTADAARLAKLEEQIATMVAAAAADPQKQRIPQIAALAGKVADLESTLATQLSQVRQGVTKEIDARLAQSQEASEAARSGTVRVDRELAGVKSEATRLGQRVDGLKTTADKLEQSVKSLQDDTTALKADIAAQMKSVAKPADVSAAIAPVTQKLAALDKSVETIAKREDDRRGTAERIVLSLELANLRRAVDRGGAFAAELAEVKKLGPKLDLKALEANKDKGVPTIADLTKDFRALSHEIIAADKVEPNAGVVDRLLSSAKAVVRVRKTDAASDDGSAEAIVARMDAALKAGQPVKVAEEAKKLSSQALAVAKPWLERVEARGTIDKALAAIDAELKSALAQSGNAKGTQ